MISFLKIPSRFDYTHPHWTETHCIQFNIELTTGGDTGRVGPENSQARNGNWSEKIFYNFEIFNFSLEIGLR